MPGPFGHLLFGFPPFGVDVAPGPTPGPVSPMSGGAGGHLVRMTPERKRRRRRADPDGPPPSDRFDEDDFEDLLGLLL